MKKTLKTDTVHFNENGQIAVPHWLCKQLGIKEGTRALVYAKGDTIVLQPITSRYIKNLRGSLKGSGLLKSLMDDRKRERGL